MTLWFWMNAGHCLWSWYLIWCFFWCHHRQELHVDNYSIHQPATSGNIPSSHKGYRRWTTRAQEWVQTRTHKLTGRGYLKPINKIEEKTGCVFTKMHLSLATSCINLCTFSPSQISEGWTEITWKASNFKKLHQTRHSNCFSPNEK